MANTLLRCVQCACVHVCVCTHSHVYPVMSPFLHGAALEIFKIIVIFKLDTWIAVFHRKMFVLLLCTPATVMCMGRLRSAANQFTPLHAS